MVVRKTAKSKNAKARIVKKKKTKVAKLAPDTVPTKKQSWLEYLFGDLVRR
jgi:hypothetical protein